MPKLTEIQSALAMIAGECLKREREAFEEGPEAIERASFLVNMQGLPHDLPPIALVDVIPGLKGRVELYQGRERAKVRVRCRDVRVLIAQLVAQKVPAPEMGLDPAHVVKTMREQSDASRSKITMEGT